jgi:hypothetical protein
VVRHAPEIVVIQPHRMRRGEVGAEQAEPVHVGDQRLAVFLPADDRLHLALADMGVQADAMLARHPGAAA